MKRGRAGLSKSTVSTPAWARLLPKQGGKYGSPLEAHLSQLLRTVRLELKAEAKGLLRSALFSIKDGLERIPSRDVSDSNARILVPILLA